MRKFFKSAILVLALILVVGILGFTLWLRDRYVVPILTYHHVGNYSDGSSRNLNTVSTKSFEFQMSFLRKHGYQVIDFDDLVEGIKKGYTFSRNTVIIHFDDGYEDNYTNAFPILKKSFRDIVHNEAPEEFQQIVVNVVMSVDDRIKGIHLLRSREFGPYLFVDFHMKLPDKIPLGSSLGLLDKTPKIRATYRGQSIRSSR